MINLGIALGWKYDNGELVDWPESLGPRPTVAQLEVILKEHTKYLKRMEYRRLRAVSYPKVTDQLDALWHAMDQGKLTKIEEFYDPIKAVKERYPK